MEVKLNKVNENPFYGMTNTLNLFQNAEKATISDALLNKCWKETYVGGNPDIRRKQMLFSLLFSLGDITARSHNIFRNNNVDSGGNAQRENFRKIMLWMKENHPEQYNRFLFSRLFNEYTTFDNLLAARVKTKKKTDKVVELVDMLGDEEQMETLATYITTIIEGKSIFDKYLVAKYLTRPRLSKRQGHKKMLPETIRLMKKKTKLLMMISDKHGFAYEKRGGYVHFSGYYEWRKQYIGSMESVLFSSGAISEYDRHQFISWLDKIPATARLRVKNRVVDKDDKPEPKWGDMGLWYMEWESNKLSKQSEKRVIEEKVRQGDKSEDTIQKLKEVTKESKVTTGAVNFKSMFGEIVTGQVDEVKIEPFLDKVNLPYNNLVFVDDSGSMSAVRDGKYGFSAFDFGAFMATICLMKNPSDIGRSMMGLFSSTTRIINHIDAIRKSNNSLMLGSSEQVSLPLYQPEISFLQNLHNMRGMLNANRMPKMTFISSIPDKLHQWTKGESDKIEMLQEFPVWTFITDGNFNSMPSPESSMNDFMYRCEQYFGFKPFIVAIDVGRHSASGERFSGIENFMYLPANPAQIEQFLTNFRDMDTMDVFTPLLSMYRSNRYAIVRDNVI